MSSPNPQLNMFRIVPQQISYIIGVVWDTPIGSRCYNYDIYRVK